MAKRTTLTLSLILKCCPHCSSRRCRWRRRAGTPRIRCRCRRPAHQAHRHSTAKHLPWRPYPHNNNQQHLRRTQCY
ncbi:hypothetical protein F5141DRAFT_1145382 [Pisolithus sp. B1]|nr:hypothetical protein F5141DRAFT_1145382 [Pisolithus sp. B1]